MRIDDFLSTVGIVKRRTVAKQMGASGLIEVNGRKVKPAYDVKIQDVICIKGNHSIKIEILAIPVGSVPKHNRENFYKEL